jgi:hypothetical protein
MKLHNHLFACSLPLLVLIGCDKKEETPAVPPPTAPVPSPSVNMDRTATDLQNAAGSASSAAANAGTSALDAAKEAGADIGAQAQRLYDQAEAYIKDKKWSDAEAVVKQLETLKAKLPAEWQAKVDSLRQSLDTARKAVTG